MDNSDNKNQQRYIFSILSKLKASGGDGTTPDFSQARIEFVESLPTASANTLGVIYVIPNQDGESGSIHFTKYDGQSYSWVAAGEKGEAGATPNISIGTVTSGEQASATIGGTPANPILNLVLPQGPQGLQGNTGSSVDYPFELVNNRTTNDATKGLTAAEGYRLGNDISQLRQEVNNLSGKYYGLFESVNNLPEGDAVGYAFVGTQAPFAIYNFNGTEWVDSGASAQAIYGEPGADGVGLQTVTSMMDGTVVLSLTNGDTVTIDLNHNHPQYLKYQMLQSESAMPSTPESDVLYMWPEE